MTLTPRDQVERVARIYRQNSDACAALGITLRAFSRLCKRYDVETPYARRRRQLEGFPCEQDMVLETA